MAKEASFYSKEPHQSVRCFLCAHRCSIKNESTGICGVRKNQEGILYALNYGQVVAAHIDPIEKKPLFHFFPGTTSYSLACVGCNFKCSFCQNWQISQTAFSRAVGVDGFGVTPDKIVQEAKLHNCPSISYTYTEPTIYFEFAYDCAKQAKENGLYNVFVTNGYMSKEALVSISPYLDAANVDLKSFRQDFYHTFCKASLQPVLESIALMHSLNIWLEITTLIIPGANDSEDQLRDIARFLCSIDASIPWHLSAFHPDYKLTDVCSTPAKTLEKAYGIGKDEGLKYVYMGNIYTPRGENTYCPSCKQLLIEREGFLVKQQKIKEGTCPYCGIRIEGLGPPFR
ncbi:MAG: AmmeMemoRadiSam system radical SAM enzyme [Candidatus Omnitrophota bacterium]